MTGSENQVRLHRDALGTPWGFRLQGGKDFKTPLTVQRVFVGSPADGGLQRGDVILAIENIEASNLSHKHAQDIIKQSGGSLSLRVKRGGGGGLRSVSAPESIPNFSAPYQPVKPLDLSPTRSGGGTLGFIPSKPHTTMAKPNTPSFGIDYSSHLPRQRPGRFGAPKHGPTYPGSMLNKLNQSLNDSIYSATSEGPEYEPHRSLSEIKQQFSQGPQSRQGQGRHRPGPSYQSKPWQKPDGSAAGLQSGLREPGWSPGQGNQQQHSGNSRGWAPVRSPGYPLAGGPVSPPVNRQPARHQQVHHQRSASAPQQPHHIQSDGPPAWAGSLKSSGAPKRWDEDRSVGHQHRPMISNEHPPAAVAPHQPRVQRVTYGPGDSAPVYSQDPRGQDAETAHVVHQQYNTPIGLYSRDNVDAALHQQTHGKPGEGTLQVSGGQNNKAKTDWSQSELFQMIHAEDARHHPVTEHSARYHQHAQGQEMQYQGYVDHNKQSPSMHALEHQVEDGTVGQSHPSPGGGAPHHDLYAGQPGGCSDF